MYQTCKLYDFHPTIIYLFKVNNRNTRKICKICLKLTIKAFNKELFYTFF